MRIAIISDIHSNLAAFEAVLDHIQTQHVDRVIINGDVINAGPDAVACLELAYRTGHLFVAGNHERYIRDFDKPNRPPEWDSDDWKPSLWTVQQLGLERRKQLHDLAWSFEHEGLLVVHASLRHDQDSIFAPTPMREIAGMFHETAAQTIVRSHNHIPQYRPWHERMIVTTGAVGQPLDGNPWAKYAIAEQHEHGWFVKHRVVPYDTEATRRSFHASGFYDFAYPMSRLYLREVMVGTHHVVPFLRFLHEWRNEDPTITSAQAMQRFMEI